MTFNAIFSIFKTDTNHFYVRINNTRTQTKLHHFNTSISATMKLAQAIASFGLIATIIAAPVVSKCTYASKGG